MALGLFDTNGFIPRIECSVWPEWLMAEWVVGQILSALAFYLIAVALCILWIWGRHKLPQGYIIFLFAMVFFLCGTQHALDPVLFWHPIYKLQAHLVFVMGLFSAAAAAVLPWVVKYFLTTPSPLELTRILEQRNEQLRLRARAEKTLEDQNQMLEEQMERMEEILTQRLWYVERRQDIDALHKIVQEIRHQGPDSAVRKGDSKHGR